LKIRKQQAELKREEAARSGGVDLRDEPFRSSLYLIILIINK